MEWPILYEVERLCSPGDQSICSDYRMSDGQPSVCGHPQDNYLDLESERVHEQELINYGIVSFDNLGVAMITIFQILTMEGWTNMMYNYMDSNESNVLVVIYFCLVVLFGSFFVMNLILAAIMDSFDQNSQQDLDIDIKEELKLQGDGSPSSKEGDSPTKSKSDFTMKINQADPSDSARLQDDNPLKKLFSTPTQVQKQRQINVQDIDQKNEDSTNQDQDIDKAMKDLNSKSPMDVLDQLTGKQQSEKTPIVKKLVEADKKQDSQKQDSERDMTSKLKLNMIKFPPQSEQKEEEQINSYKASRCVRLIQYLYEDEEHIQVPDRAKKNSFYYVFYKVSMSRFFSTLIFIFIILNTVVLALDRYPITQEEDEMIHELNNLFSWIFTAEMVIKLLGFGFKGYIQDGFNIFDGTIVILNLMDVVIFGILELDGLSNASGALQSFRCIRLLRVVKLARSWTALQRIIVNTGKSLKDIANFSLLLFLFIFIFDLLGMELFAYKVSLDLEGEIIPIDEQDINESYESPRANFDTFFNGFQAIFIVIIGEDWNAVMYSHYRALGPVVQIYFITLLIFGNFILLSLFTAILLKNFEDDSQEEQQQILGIKEKQRKEAAHKKTIAKSLSNMVQAVVQKDSQDEIKKEEEVSVNLSQEESQRQKKELKIKTLKDANFAKSFPNLGISVKKLTKSGTLSRKFNDNFSLTQFHNEGKSFAASQIIKHQLQGKSLYIFHPWNKFRKFLYDMISTQSFDNFILILIILSTCMLAMESPLTDPDGKIMEFLQVADKIMTLAFFLEMVIKVIAFGFIINGKDSYLKNGWNQLDFMIVIASLIILVNQNNNLKFIKAIRIFRVLRPLRMIQRQKGLKVAVISMINAIPDILNLQMIVLFVFFLMGILGTTFFKGRMNFCYTDNLGDIEALDLFQLYGHDDYTKWDCLNSGGEWLRNELNFDNPAVSMQTLFILQSTEGWVDMLWTGIDSTEIDYYPVRDNKPAAFFFFMASIILFSLFFLNLFVGVVIDTFQREKDILMRNSELNMDQREWISIYTMILQSSPQLKFNKTGNAVVDFCRSLSSHYIFESVILACIILNTVVLALTWYGESEQHSQVTAKINTYFNILFTVEALIKLYGFRKFYFYDGWNVFDFIVVLGTWVLLGYSKILGSSNLSTQGTLLRTFRIGRVFRVVKRLKDLKVIFNTLIEAIPSLASVGGLLMLLFFLYAIMGTFLFSTVMLNNSLGDHVHFQDFGTAFLLLFRMSTGESWFQIMFDYSRTYNLMYQCENDVDYYTIQANGGHINGCGKPIVALLYFVSFQMIVSQIFLNLFIAIIIEAFGDQNEIESMSLLSEDVTCFQDCWKEFDPTATGFIDCKDLEDLILMICRTDSDLIPIKRIIIRYSKARKQLIMKMKNPTFYNFTKYSYYDTLKKLAEHKCELKFCIQKISTAKNVICQKINKEGGDLKENKFQKFLQLQLTKMVAVKESDDFDVFLNEIAEADQEIEIVAQMVNFRKKVYKKIGTYLDYKHGQIFDSQHQILIPVIQKHIKSLQAKKYKKEEEEAFGSHKKDENSQAAMKSALGITSDSDLITRATSHQPANDQKLLSQLSLAKSSNTNQTHPAQNTDQNSLNRDGSTDFGLKVPSPTTQIKSNRHNKNMLISENYDIKVTELEVNDKIGKAKNQSRSDRLHNLTQVQSGDTDNNMNHNNKIGFKGDVIYEKQNEDSMLEEVDDPDYAMIEKSDSKKRLAQRSQVKAENAYKKQFSSKMSSKLSNNFIEGDDKSLRTIGSRKDSKERQAHNESINHMIEDAGFDINDSQQKTNFMRDTSPYKINGNISTLDKIVEEKVLSQRSDKGDLPQIQKVTGTQLNLEMEILDDYKNGNIEVLPNKKKRTLDTLDRMMDMSGELDSLEVQQREHQQQQQSQPKQVSLQSKFDKPQ